MEKTYYAYYNAGESALYSETFNNLDLALIWVKDNASALCAKLNESSADYEVCERFDDHIFIHEVGCINAEGKTFFVSKNQEVKLATINNFDNFF